jgi:ubiquinone/menaquinone biosynthesis C-methylase UbiE
MTVATLAIKDVAAVLGRHIPLYRRRPPAYQTVMLNALGSLWQGRPARLLDVGGGTGVIGQAIQDLFPVGRVQSVDVENRYLPGLSIDTRTYDGTRLPFADGEFEAATINNVLHHVPVAARTIVMREVRRVVSGPVYIKDHLSAGRLDDIRLALLDLAGNVPFSGMVRADYLAREEWESLARSAGFRIGATRADRYRHGVFAALFPNRLEITMRWEPADR